ncbi:Chorismate synthase [Chlamydia trachomatis]|nr:Chorismate synthase [Chlamydia trachomatis]
MPLILTCAMKPIPTLMQPLASVNLETLEADEACVIRSDVCAVPAAAIVAESRVAFVLANAYIQKFGGDCMIDCKAALEHYRARLRTMAR